VKIGRATAGLLLLAALLTGVPAEAQTETTIVVTNEAEYRAALATLSADNSGPHTIFIDGSVHLRDPGDPTYTGTQPLTILGNGEQLNFLSANWDGIRILHHDTTAPLTITGGVILQGGQSSGDGGGILAGGDVTVLNSLFGENISETSGGAIAAQGDVTITGSAFLGSDAPIGSLVDAGGSVTITNSSVFGQSGGSVIRAGAGVSLVYASIGQNEVDPDGAAVEAASLDSYGSLVVDDTAACIVRTTTSSWSYDTDGSCGFTGQGDTSAGPDPEVEDAFFWHNTINPVLYPSLTSPLRDAIPGTECHPTITDDQRDSARPIDGDDNGTAECDIGAVEAVFLEEEPPPPPPTTEPPGEPPPTTGPVAATPSFTG
jgi:predicted outer membrane repeat protein